MITDIKIKEFNGKKYRYAESDEEIVYAWRNEEKVLYRGTELCKIRGIWLDSEAGAGPDCTAVILHNMYIYLSNNERAKPLQIMLEDKNREYKPRSFDTENEKSQHEKAKEIAENDSLYGNSDDLSKIDECYIAAMQMAVWKDSQFINFLKREMDSLKDEPIACSTIKRLIEKW